MNKRRTVKFLHTADWQFGYRQYGFQERELDFYAAGAQVVKAALDQKVDAVVIAGDMFEMQKAPALAVRFAQELVSKLRNAGIKVYGIDGNHDAVDSNWLVVCGIQPLHFNQVELGGVRMVGLNAMRPSMFRQELQKLATAITKPVDVLVIHQTLAEMAGFSRQELSALEMVPLLKEMGVRYVCMGDIHDYKETEIQGIRFVYSGDIERWKVDERPDKSVSIIEVTPDKVATAMYPLITRMVVEHHLRKPEDLDTLLEAVNNAGDPLVVVWYEPQCRDLAKQAEAFLDGKEILHRIAPLKGDQANIVERLAKQGLERKGALSNLKGAVGAFFDESSEQNEIVFQLLEAPDNTSEIVKQYMQSKGLAP